MVISHLHIYTSITFAHLQIENQRLQFCIDIDKHRLHIES